MSTQLHREMDPEEGAGAAFVTSLPTILWQRRWLIIVPFLLASIGGITAAYVIHPVYQSTATMLVEAQQVPEDMLGNPNSQVTDMLSQRVARARERVLSRQELIQLIRAYGLYPREQQTMPLSKVVEKMRSDTSINTIDTDPGSSAIKRSMGISNTIAITIAFNYDDPVKAQTVTQQYVNHFLEVDATAQQGQAVDTVNFLSEQANQTARQIAALEDKITQIKSANGTVLVLGQTSGNTSSDLSRVDSEIAALNADIAKLQATPGAGRGDDNGVAAAEANLRVAQAKFSDSHPDVIAAKAQLAAAKRAAAAPVASGPNPAAGAIAADRMQIASLRSAREQIAASSSSLQSAQSRAPAIAAQIDQYEKQADLLREQQRGIGLKLQAAQISARMESEQKGERLTLSDPPVVPDSPIKPNRPVLILGSIAGGLVFGLGFALLLEFVLRPIRGTAAVRNAVGQAPLAVIPDFDHKPGWIVRLIEKRTRKTRFPAPAE